ncbi:HAAS signaling domain-containing protein [Jatrophihabitans sp. YIM 134969]
MTAMPTLDQRADYVAAVAAGLADLAPDDRAELVEELADHVAALLEERPDADLSAELGTPRAYAAELRAAAGLVGAPAAAPTVSTRLRDLVRHVDSAQPWIRPTGRFLRPAWWVLRGVVVGAAAGLVLGFGYPSGGAYLLLVLGVLASLWLAQRAPATPPWKVGIRVVDVVAAALALYVLSVLGSTRILTEYSTQFVNSCPTEIDNLYAYDTAGRPIDGVRLYDQDGNPFDIGALGCDTTGRFGPGAQPNVYPWPSAAPLPQEFPTGPPSSLAPLPGATVSTAAGSTTPTGTGTPKVTSTPSGSSSATPSAAAPAR